MELAIGLPADKGIGNLAPASLRVQRDEVRSALQESEWGTVRNVRRGSLPSRRRRFPTLIILSVSASIKDSGSSDE